MDRWSMSERQAFGPNLRRLRVQRGISLERIAATTKISPDLWAGLERNDFSRWPTGIYARSYVRAYAQELGSDPDATVDQFCRLFPAGDRRVGRVVREQAALVGHDSRWKDDLVGSVTAEKRANPPASTEKLPPIAFTRTGRLVAATVDAAVIVAAAAGAVTLFKFRWGASLAACALTYHAASLLALGSTPSVWVIETYLANRHPSTSRAGRQRFPRLLHRSEGSRLS
jgi:transcriptional regulator with XRE-family HTH domain